MYSNENTHNTIHPDDDSDNDINDTSEEIPVSIPKHFIIKHSRTYSKENTHNNNHTKRKQYNKVDMMSFHKNIIHREFCYNKRTDIDMMYSKKYPMLLHSYNFIISDDIEEAIKKYANSKLTKVKKSKAFAGMETEYYVPVTYIDKTLQSDYKINKTLLPIKKITYRKENSITIDFGSIKYINQICISNMLLSDSTYKVQYYNDKNKWDELGECHEEINDIDIFSRRLRIIPIKNYNWDKMRMSSFCVYGEEKNKRNIKHDLDHTEHNQEYIKYIIRSYNKYTPFRLSKKKSDVIFEHSRPNNHHVKTTKEYLNEYFY